MKELEIAGIDSGNISLINITEADMRKYIASLNEMTIFALSHEANILNKTLEDLEKCNSSFKLVTDSNMIELTNILDEVGYNQSRESFNTTYTFLKPMIEEALDKINTLNRDMMNSDLVKSSIYVNKQMVDEINSRIESLDKSNINYESMKSNYEYIRDAYSNVLDTSRLKDIYNNFITVNRKYISRQLREIQEDNRKHRVPHIYKDIIGVFNEDFFATVTRELLNVIGIGNKDINIDVLLIFIHKYITNKKTKTGIHVKIMLIVLYDIAYSNYDYTDKTPEEYKSELLDIFNSFLYK